MKQPQIQLPKPCSENAANFTPTLLGGYCNSCQKEVVDFRGMSKSDVALFIQKNPTNRCGIFDRVHLQVTEVPLRKIKFSGVWTLGLLGLLGLVVPAQAQEISKSATENLFGNKSVKTPEPGHNLERTVKGKIISGDGYGEIPGATVLIKGHKIGTTTDINGRFELAIPDSIQSEKITLVYSFIGYTVKEQILYQTQLPADFGEIALVADSATMGEYIYIPSKKNIWQKFKGVFKNDSPVLCADPKHSHSI